MAARPYKRLPGQGRQLLSNTTLWESEDHLLAVNSHSVSESYRRFYFRDIQAIVICQTKAALITNIMLGVIMLAFGVPAMMTDIPGLRMFLGIIAGSFLVLLVINMLRGPSCKCNLRTAVQTQDLPSLNRVYTARKVLAKVQAKVAVYQEEVPAP